MSGLLGLNELFQGLHFDSNIMILQLKVASTV